MVTQVFQIPQLLGDCEILLGEGGGRKYYVEIPPKIDKTF